MNINYNQLFHFYAIAKEGSIKKAAEKLHITQPTLSSQLKVLEDTLGLKLFDRKGKRLFINDNGKIILEYANRIFRISEEMLRFLNQGHHPTTRLLKIGITPMISTDMATDFVKNLKLSKQFTISIERLSYNEIKEKFKHGEIDLALTDYAFKTERNVSQKVILSTPIVPVAGILYNHLDENYPFSLEKAPVIQFNYENAISKALNNVIGNKLIKLEHSLEVNDVDMAKLLVEKNQGIGFLPLAFIEKDIEAGYLTPISKDNAGQFEVYCTITPDKAKFIPLESYKFKS